MDRALPPEEPFDPQNAYLFINPLPIRYIFDTYSFKGEHTQAEKAALAEEEECPDEDGCINLRLRPLKDKFAVFTREDIKKDQRILTMSGDLFTSEQKREMNLYCIRTNDDFVISFERQGAFFSFMRASCKPNCEMECVWKGLCQYVVVKAKGFIRRTSELTVDFNYFLTNLQILLCACEEGDNCRMALIYARENLKRF